MCLMITILLLETNGTDVARIAYDGLFWWMQNLAILGKTVHEKIWRFLFWRMQMTDDHFMI